MASTQHWKFTGVSGDLPVPSRVEGLPKLPNLRFRDKGVPKQRNKKHPSQASLLSIVPDDFPPPISAPKPQNPHHHTRIKPTITSHHARLHTNQAPKSTDPQSQTPPPLSRKPTNPVHVPNYAEIPRQPGVKTPCVPKRLKRNKRRTQKEAEKPIYHPRGRLCVPKIAFYDTQTIPHQTLVSRRTTTPDQTTSVPRRHPKAEETPSPPPVVHYWNPT